MKCFCCGVSKDPNCFEFYLYEGDGFELDQPMNPLLAVGVEPLGRDPLPDRATVVCHDCYHELGASLWWWSWDWDARGPKVPYEKLPPMKDGLFTPSVYSDVEVPD